MQGTTLNDYLDTTLADPKRAIGFINASIAEAYPGCVYHALMKVFKAEPEYIPVLLSPYVKYLTKSEIDQLAQAYPAHASYIKRYSAVFTALQGVA